MNPFAQTTLRRPAALVFVLLALLFQAGCTTMQTTYFRGSFQPVEDVNDAAFYPYSGTSEHRMVSDMALAAEQMYSQGYGMIGYSQFVSPLFTSLAPSYATKYAATLGADLAVLETPRPGASNLHGFLVTYWKRVRPEVFSLGTYAEDLPDDLLRSLGQDYNVVYLKGVVPNTPAHAAGLRKDDVILAINGERITSSEIYVEKVRKNMGKEAVISVSRYGELEEFTVSIGQAQVASTYSYHDRPWRNTAPTDWSMLSAANTVARVRQQQIQDQERQLAYERGRQEAMRASASLDSGYEQAYSGYVSERQARAQGLIGSYTRSDRLRGIAPPGAREWSLEYGGFLDNFKGLSGNPNELDSLDIWFSHAPNIYGQLFTFPRPQVY